MRGFKDYFFIYLKGIAMGSADVVPGVSGGTIAFISGIYDELINSISAVKPHLLQDLLKGNIKEVWQKVNGNFLICLLAGVATSILSLAKLITYLMQFYPIQLWAFFFGLILASIIYIGKQIKNWNLGSLLGITLGALFIFAISSMPPLATSNSYFFLFVAGAIAACAMILPGISGSFILLLLGAYSTVITAIGNQDLAVIGVVGVGAVTGLISFSKLLHYLLNNYHNTVVGVLTGFLIGSLWKIWPWKSDEMVYVKEIGTQSTHDVLHGFGSLSAFMQTQSSEHFDQVKTYIEHNISPFQYEIINPNTQHGMIYAALFCLIGFSLIFIIEYLAKSRNV